MSKNDITGDRLVSKASTDAFREGHDRIFNKTPPLHDGDGPGEEDGPWAAGWAQRCGQPDVREICYWADGCWCERNEVHEYTHKSDDYACIQVSHDLSDEDVDRIVFDAVGG